jgi:hypothetical protein
VGRDDVGRFGLTGPSGLGLGLAEAFGFGFIVGFGLGLTRAPSPSSAYGLWPDFTSSRIGVPGSSKLSRIELTR